MQDAKPGCVGVVVKNAVAYVDAVLNVLEAGSTVVLLRSPHEAEHLHRSCRPERTIVPDAPAGGWYARHFRACWSDEPAIIAHTSGTEGKPKAVVLSHRALADTVTRLHEVMEVQGSIREYVGVPVHHSFGFGRCRAVAAVGGSFYVPSAGFNPGEIRRMLEAKAINAISAVPSLWRVVLAQPDVIGRAGQDVRWIEIGSQYMCRAEKEQLRELFPCAAIVQHYGLTEASRATLLRIDRESGESLESVGRAVGATEIRVGRDDKISVRGPHLASGYLTAEGLQPLADAEGWFVTQDLGRIQDGFLYYEGRADDVINSSGIKVQPELVEAKLREILQLDMGFAVARRRDPLRGEAFLGVYERSSGLTAGRLEEAIEEALQSLRVRGRNAVVVCEMDAIPRTPAGKTRRSEISRWYEDGLWGEDADGPPPSSSFAPPPASDPSGIPGRLATILPRPNAAASEGPTSASPGVWIETGRAPFVAPRTALERSMASLWEEIFGRAPIGIKDDFFDLGGHSLLAVLLVTRIKSRLGKEVPLSRLLDHKTVESLAASMEVADEGPEARSHLVTLRSGGSELPLVLFPGAGGYSFVYHDLPAHLSKDRPVYAFHAIGVEDSAAAELNVEGMAEIYVREFLDVGPAGACVLGGYSFGVLVAFEVARRLLELGHRVPLLISLDGFAPGFPRLMPLRQRLASHVKAILDGGAEARKAYWQHRLRNVKMRVFHRLGRSHDGMDDVPFADVETNERLRKLWVSAARARNQYAPKVTLPCDLLLIKAGTPRQWVGVQMDDPVYGWDAFVRGNIATVTVPGEHLKLLERNNWRTIARAIDLQSARCEASIDERPVRVAGHLC